MDKNEVGERFRNLATGSLNRPEAARLRDIFDEVEVALKARVPQAEVLAELNKLGFADMKMGAFKSALQRIRKERAEQGATTFHPKTMPGSKSMEAAPAAIAPSKQQESVVTPQPKSKNVLHALARTPDELSHIPSAQFEVDKSN